MFWGVIWVIAVVSVIFGFYAREHWSSQSRKIEQLAKIYSSIDIFERTPVMNHAGNLFGLMHSTPRGMGVFIADTKTKTEQKIIEAKSADFLNDYTRYNPDANQIFGWSPDDSAFAFFWNYTLMMVTNGVDAIPAKTLDEGINSFTWISVASCAFIDDSKKLTLLNNAQGQWNEVSSWQLSDTNGFPHFLTAVNTDTMAWTTDNGLWQMDLKSGDIKSLYFDSAKRIAHVSYCKETDTFLFLANIRARRTNLCTFVTLQGQTNLSVIKTIGGDQSADRIQWLNHGNGYAYSGFSTLTVKAGTNAPEQNVFNGQIYGTFCDPNGSSVYVLASKTNDAPGLWGYDINSKNVSCVFSPWGFQNVEAHYQPVIPQWAPYEKHVHQYKLIPPVNFSRQKKYPLVIAMDSYYWTGTAQATYAQCMANCGAVVAMSGYRYHQDDQNLESYTNIMLAIYNQLSASPNIDTNRIFLFTPSSASVVLNKLARQFPTRWRGIIFAGPTSFLEPTNATLTTLNSTNARISWRPLVSQAGTTNSFSVKVADNGAPSLSATNNFTVTVNPLGSLPSIGSIVPANGNSFNLTIAGPTGPDYSLLTSTNLLDWQTLLTSNSPATPFTLTITNQNDAARFYQIQIGP